MYYKINCLYMKYMYATLVQFCTIFVFWGIYWPCWCFHLNMLGTDGVCCKINKTIYFVLIILTPSLQCCRFDSGVSQVPLKINIWTVPFAHSSHSHINAVMTYHPHKLHFSALTPLLVGSVCRTEKPTIVFTHVHLSILPSVRLK